MFCQKVPYYLSKCLFLVKNLYALSPQFADSWQLVSDIFYALEKDLMEKVEKVSYTSQGQFSPYWKSGSSVFHPSADERRG